MRRFIAVHSTDNSVRGKPMRVLSALILGSLVTPLAAAQSANPFEALKDAATQAVQAIKAKQPQSAQSQTSAQAGQPQSSATPLAMQSQPGTVPAAPAGGIDPSKLPDLQGIHLGMSPEEILPRLKTLYPGPGGNTTQLGVSTANVKYINVPANPWMGTVMGQVNACAATGGACGGRFYVTFSAPPSKPVAVYLKRTVAFEVGKFPTPDTIIAALKQKYGANPVMLDATTLGWGFDESGQPLSRDPQDKKSQPPCRNSQVLAPNHSIIAYTASQGPLDPQELKHWILMKCGLAINVVAQLYQSTNNGVLGVSGFDVTMTEDGEDIRDALAGEQFIENAHKAAQQQQLNNAQQQKVPTL
jgi:hypothetical protein